MATGHTDGCCADANWAITDWSRLLLIHLTRNVMGHLAQPDRGYAVQFSSFLLATPGLCDKQPRPCAAATCILMLS